MGDFIPSTYQSDVKDWFLDRKGKNLVVEAVAGSGKTKTGIWLWSFLTPSEQQDSVYVAFNKSIADNLKTKLPQGSNAMTYHALGLRAITRTEKKTKVDADKVDKILKNYVGQNDKFTIPSTKRLVSICKNLLISDYDNENTLMSLAVEYDIDLYDDESDFARGIIFRNVGYAMRQSYNIRNEIDFDDMIWLPNVDDTIMPLQFNLMLVDELQDTNLAQMYLVINSIHQGGSVIGIGDTYQSIYGFRGANQSAMADFANQLNAERLPLSICYRCPTVIRDYVNNNFPYIKFETPEWAVAGTLNTIKVSELDKNIQLEDMVLCRINADLVPVAFSLIRRGIKATIKGRDIGKSLVTLIKKQRAMDVPELFEQLYAFRDKQMDKFLRMDKPHKIAQLDDQIKTIEVISEGADTIQEVIKRCEDLFSDYNSAVTLSSIHKAKGLESKNVHILRPDLLPHPLAKRPDQQKQEMNLKYVAVTRAMENLNFVEGQVSQD